MCLTIEKLMKKSINRYGYVIIFEKGIYTYKKKFCKSRVYIIVYTYRGNYLVAHLAGRYELCGLASCIMYSGWVPNVQGCCECRAYRKSKKESWQLHSMLFCSSKLAKYILYSQFHFSMILINDKKMNNFVQAFWICLIFN